LLPAHNGLGTAANHAACKMLDCVLSCRIMLLLLLLLPAAHLLGTTLNPTIWVLRRMARTRSSCSILLRQLLLLLPTAAHVLCVSGTQACMENTMRHFCVHGFRRRSCCWGCAARASCQVQLLQLNMRWLLCMLLRQLLSGRSKAAENRTVAVRHKYARNLDRARIKGTRGLRRLLLQPDAIHKLLLEQQHFHHVLQQRCCSGVLAQLVPGGSAIDSLPANGMLPTLGNCCAALMNRTNSRLAARLSRQQDDCFLAAPAAGCLAANVPSFAFV
jgi:hypothetical protein